MQPISPLKLFLLYLQIPTENHLGGVAPVLLECRRTYLPQNDMSIPGTGASKRSLFSMSWHFEELQFIC